MTITICLGPAPAHLAALPWYLSHHAWLATRDWPHHDPCGASPARADMPDAYLRGADLRDAYMSGAYMPGADLRGADLRGADLRGFYMRCADLKFALMPDGRSWESYRADPLAGICREPEVRARAIAAWGHTDWHNCPLNAAHGWDSMDDVPDGLQRLVACFISAHDAGLLPAPAAEVRA